MNPAYLTLTMYVFWVIICLVVVAYLRLREVKKGNVIKDLNPPLADNIPPFIQRMVRVHGNALENLPLFIAVVFIANITGNINVIGYSAYAFMMFRIGQSLVHAYSDKQPWINVRGLLFLSQIVIMVYWLVMIILSSTGHVSHAPMPHELMPHEVTKHQLMPHEM